MARRKIEQKESLSEKERILSSGQMLATTFAIVKLPYDTSLEQYSLFLGLLPMKKATPIKHPRITGKINRKSMIPYKSPPSSHADFATELDSRGHNH